MTSGTAYTIADGEGFPEVTGGAAQCSAVEQTDLSLRPFPHGNLLTHLRATPDPEDVRKYFRALRRAQRDIDLRPELYTHYYQKEFPCASMTRWIRGAGARVSGSYSSRTRSRHLMNRSSGSSNMASSRAAGWAAGNTKARSSHKLPNRPFFAHGRKTPLPRSHQTTLM